jgi:hypothetical protein
MWSVYAHVSEETRYTGVESDTFFFFVEPTIPDLIISSFIVDPLVVEPDENVNIHFQVENLGMGAAEWVTIFVTAHSNKGEIIIHKEVVNKINAGNFEIINFKWPAIFGFDILAVEIDPSNSILETNEENNRITQEIDVGFKNDISIKNIHISPKEIKEGDTVTIIAEVLCTGEVTECVIEFWAGEPGKGHVIDAKTLKNPSKRILEVSWAAALGTHLICVVADREKKVNEFDEDNNILKERVTVETVEKTFPLAETAISSIAAASAAAYWYLKHRGHSSHVKKPAKVPHRPNPVRHVPSAPPALEPAGEDGPIILYRAGKALLKAGATTAATEAGAKLYKMLYNRYYHWNKAKRRNFEEIFQQKMDILDKVINQLFVFEGYIDTEDFCRFFNVDESELKKILDFLYWNGYIEEVYS